MALNLLTLIALISMTICYFGHNTRGMIYCGFIYLALTVSNHE